MPRGQRPTLWDLFPVHIPTEYCTCTVYIAQYDADKTAIRGDQRSPEIIISHDNLRWNDLLDSVTCVGTENASTGIKKFVHR
jgi:hypothetical protein